MSVLDHELHDVIWSKDFESEKRRAKALAAVLSLHTVYVQNGDYCEHCNRISGVWHDYPCETVRTIAAALGVEA